MARMALGRNDAIWRVTGVQLGAGQHGRGGVWAGTPTWLARQDRRARWDAAGRIASSACSGPRVGSWPVAVRGCGWLTVEGCGLEGPEVRACGYW